MKRQRNQTIPLPGASAAGVALLQLGFRPFYLAAALFAATIVPVWVLVYGDWLHSVRIDLFWHMHEMLFGFAAAVLVGFLLTAVPNWTGMSTPRGMALGALALLWLMGRVAAVSMSPLAFAAVDWPFLPLVAAILLRNLLRTNNRRNLPVAGLLTLLALANLAFHAGRLGWTALSPLRSMHAALMLLLFFIALIGGRVAPMFTRNGAPGSRPRQVPRLDLACLLTLALGACCWLAPAPPALDAAALLLAAILHGVRLALWDPLATLRFPLLWTFHLSYALLVVGLGMLAASAVGLVGASSALHVLAIGAMAGMIGAMMTRTALGHTGRPLQAGRAEVTMYVLLPLGAALRVGANAAGSGARLTLLALGALCWSLAFLLYLLRYAPYLSRPRVDGRPG